MDALRGIGMAAFLVVSVAVGLRLLCLATRTRKLPELAIGAGFLLAGGLGYPLVFVPELFPGVPRDLHFPVAALGLLCFHLGAGSLWVAVWRIFRPEAGWALALVTAALLLLAITFARDALVDRRPIPSPELAWYWVGLSVRIGALPWAAIEALLYHAMLRRRLLLGLADRAAALHMLLWGLGASAAFAMSVNGVAMRLVPGWAAHPAGVWVSSLLGLVAATLIWSTYFPPRALRARLARAGAPAPVPTPDPVRDR